MGATTVQLLAALMAAAHGALWVMASRWERRGRTAQLRARIAAPALVTVGSDVGQVAPLVYPVLVVAAPGWAYEGWLNWSSSSDFILQAIGIGIWAVGVSVVFWAAGTMGRYMDVNGVTVDHELIVHGPYRYVRHPIYGSFAAVAVGTALTFRSYLVVALAVAWVASTWWWATAEEELLASPAGFGDAYRTYADRTGRFLPRVRLLSR